MPTWLAILIGAVVMLTGVLGTWGTLGLKIRERWEGNARWKGQVDADRKSFTEFMQEVRTDIKKILGYVGPRLSTPGSPVVLNELGKKVSGAMGIKAWAKDTAPGLLEEIADRKEHQIYDFCVEYAKNMDLTEEQIDISKALAYEHWFPLRGSQNSLRHQASGRPAGPPRGGIRRVASPRRRLLATV